MSDDHNGTPPGSVGTVALDAPVTRAEFERALRAMQLAIENAREDVVMLAGQVVATGEVIGRDAEIEERTPAKIQEIRETVEQGSSRVQLGYAEDKYRASVNGPDCLSILPICKGVCCKLHFPLSSQDLDEGVIRFDYGKPYVIRQRLEDDKCVHNDPEKGCCTVYEHRPRPCRTYDCRNDQRIWADFDNKILADNSPFTRKEGPEVPDFADRVRQRHLSMAMEAFSIGTNEAERTRFEKKQR